ncbi:ferritin [Rubritalea marina]|uniref:ferritin n=1 Tax=Rubritalea marina TaxID=361055 RepID=UPI00036DA7B4|nr:ferritin [Rubritalea marina]
MLEKELQDALNSQINQELTAAYNYLAISAYFEEENLVGFANWMRMQHQEEMEHAERLQTYLLDRGGHLELEAIEKPRSEFSGALEAFEFSLETEQENTRSINALYEKAFRLNDHATKTHLQWFLTEQVEEEKSVEEVITTLRMIGDDVAGLLYLNDKLGERKHDESEEA